MAKRLRDEDRELWRAAMRGVEPLVPGAVAAPPAAAPAAPLHRRPRSVARPVAQHERDVGIDRRTLGRLKRGEMPVDARLDLHGLTQDAAHRALGRFLAEAAADGVRLALVITGKGRGGAGVLREAVPRWLAEPINRARILTVTPAPPKHGGSGALCVLLRRVRERAARS